MGPVKCTAGNTVIMDDYTSLDLMYMFIILYVCLPGSEIGKTNYCKTMVCGSCGINETVRDFVPSGFYLSPDPVSLWRTNAGRAFLKTPAIFHGEQVHSQQREDMWPFDHAASCGLCTEQMQDPSVNTSLCRGQIGRYNVFLKTTYYTFCGET